MATSSAEAMPISRAMAVAVCGWSPVIITTRMPAARHFAMASLAWVVQARKFFHQVRVRQTVKAVALNAPRVEASGNRNQLRDPRHGLVERGAEAHHLREPGLPPQERLDQGNLARQMIGRVGRDPVQFRQQRRCDRLGFKMLHAVHDAVSRGCDRREDRLRLQPVQQRSYGRAVVGRGQRARSLRGSAGSLTMNVVSLTPMRSILPSSRRRSVSLVSYTANRMLDDPPLNTTTQGTGAVMGPSGASFLRIPPNASFVPTLPEEVAGCLLFQGALPPDRRESPC